MSAEKKDLHHLCWPRSSWNAGYAHAIRNYPYFVVELPKDTVHREIHHQMRQVPVPSAFAAHTAWQQIKILEHFGVLHPDDPPEKRLGILVGLFDCSSQKTADAFRRQAKIIRKYANKKPLE